MSVAKSALRGLQKTVIDGIGRSIIGGAVAPGNFLATEPELGAKFGVSRTSVREAMRVLSAKGLVEIRQKIGTRVQEKEFWNIFDADILRWHHEEGQGDAVMRDLIELRQVLEPAAARLAAGRATIENHRRLKLAITAMENSVQSAEAYAQADLEFHLAVYSASHNSLMWQFGTVVGDFLRRAFLIQQKIVREPAELSKDVSLHAQVYQAIDRGDGEAAASAMLLVVLEGKSALIQALDSIDQSGLRTKAE
jgi:DNA-binding FadR family transcriptional regulator